MASTIWAPVAASWSVVTPFTVAAVPTGMKRGVSTTPWGVWKLPQRARVWGQRAVISKAKAAPAANRVKADQGRADLNLGGVASGSIPAFSTP